MKLFKNIIIVLGVFALFPTTAQSQTHEKVEIGVGLVGTRLSPFGDGSFFVPVQKVMVRKYFDESQSIQLSVRRPFVRSRQSQPSNWISDYDYRENLLGLGYTKILKQSRWSAFYSIEGNYFRSAHDGLIGGGFAGQYHEFDILRNGVGLTPSVGARFAITQHIFLNVQSEVGLFWIKEDRTDFSYSGTIIQPLYGPEQSSSSSFKVIANPLEVSLSVKF